jgi:hypothetical protein
VGPPTSIFRDPTPRIQKNLDPLRDDLPGCSPGCQGGGKVIKVAKVATHDNWLPKPAGK